MELLAKSLNETLATIYADQGDLSISTIRWFWPYKN